MPRLPRRELTSRHVHITCRTIRRLPLFVTERDAWAMLDLIDRVTAEVEWEILSYCLMPNHIHYVVTADVDQLSLAMRRINGGYAQRFNREHGYTGHLFQGRFGTKPIRDEAHLPGAIRYVELNPIRAALCEHPEQWRWSSFRALAGLEPAPRFLSAATALALFADNEDAAQRAFRAFVEDEMPCGDRTRGQSLGQSPFVRAQPSRWAAAGV